MEGLDYNARDLASGHEHCIPLDGEVDPGPVKDIGKWKPGDGIRGRLEESDSMSAFVSDCHQNSIKDRVVSSPVLANSLYAKVHPARVREG